MIPRTQPEFRPDTILGQTGPQPSDKAGSAQQPDASLRPRRILVAVNAPDVAADALAQALRLATRPDAELRLVCVAPPSVFLPRTLVRRWKLDPTSHEQALERCLKAARATDGARAAAVTRKVRVGVEEVELAREAEDWKADLVVLGLGRTTWWQRWLMPDMIGELLPRLGMSVLLVPAGAGSRPDQLVVPETLTQRMTFGTMLAGHPAVKLAAGCGCPVLLARPWTPPPIPQPPSTGILPS